MELWQTILLAFGGQAVLVTVLAVIAKSLLDKLILRDTKQFESDLKAKSDATIEHLKNELHLRTIEHQVRFSRLHEKRAEVIAELNSLFAETLWEAESFLSPMEWNGEPSKPEKFRVAMKKFVELFRYFDKHRIYLPHQLCSSLESLVMEVRGLVTKFGVYVEVTDNHFNGPVQQEKWKAWTDGWEAIRNQVPQARRSLEEEFRTLLGAAGVDVGGVK